MDCNQDLLRRVSLRAAATERETMLAVAGVAALARNPKRRALAEVVTTTVLAPFFLQRRCRKWI